jgi:cation/acetate symporter
VGLVLSVALIVSSKNVWVDILGHGHRLFPYEYPTLFSLGAALLVAFLVSASDRSERARTERQAYAAQVARSEGA